MVKKIIIIVLIAAFVYGAWRTTRHIDAGGDYHGANKVIRTMKNFQP